MLRVEGGRGHGHKQSYTLLGAVPSTKPSRLRKVIQTDAESDPTGPVPYKDRSSESSSGRLARQQPTDRQPGQSQPEPSAAMPAPPPDDDEAWEAVLPSPLYGLWGGGARPARDLVRATLRTHGAIAEFKRLYRQVPAGRRKRDGDVFYEVLPTLAQQAADLDVRRIIDAADENDTTQRLAAQQARQDQARQERERNRQRCAANIEQQEGANRG